MLNNNSRFFDLLGEELHCDDPVILVHSDSLCAGIIVKKTPSYIHILATEIVADWSVKYFRPFFVDKYRSTVSTKVDNFTVTGVIKATSQSSMFADTVKTSPEYTKRINNRLPKDCF
jgi:hypothetical protein